MAFEPSPRVLQPAPSSIHGIQRKSTITELLEHAGRGSRAAEEELLSRIYADLRRIANRQVRRRPAGPTTPATALAHEVYAELVHASPGSWANHEVPGLDPARELGLLAARRLQGVARVGPGVVVHRIASHVVIASCQRAALRGLPDRPSTAPTPWRRRWYRTAPSVTAIVRAIELTLDPRSFNTLIAILDSWSSFPAIPRVQRRAQAEANSGDTARNTTGRRSSILACRSTIVGIRVTRIPHRQEAATMTETDVFKHSTPSLYDRFMGPLLFEPFAKHVAGRVALVRPERILETAAGTGIVTRAVGKAVPAAAILATDINPAVVAFAAAQPHSERVTFQQADAQDLPFGDATFDLVLCLFGVMFFPDKVRANAEAARVLRRGGRYILVTFNDLDLNPVPKAAGDAVGQLFPEDPRYMQRGPFSYTDRTAIENDLRAAGFDVIDVETIALTTRVRARDAAHGIVLGSPFRAEIERLDASALERATAAVEGALQEWDGRDAPMSAHIATATR